MICFYKKFLCIFSVIFIPFLSLGNSFREKDFLFYVVETNESNVYDPFIDYTEFERTEKERTDIRFFKEGRLVTLGAGLGGRFFTGNLLRYSPPRLNYGFQAGIFLNLNFMIQAHGLFSFHEAHLGEYSGYFQFHGGGADLKYFFDKERLNRFFSFLNPYLLVGFSAVRGTIIPTGPQYLGQRRTNIGFGFRTGLGFEIQLGERFFTGLHADFNFVEFSWEAESWEEILDNEDHIRGDLVNVLYIFGLNF